LQVVKSVVKCFPLDINSMLQFAKAEDHPSIFYTQI